MPPLYQDPLATVPRAGWRWIEIARAILDVSCEAWALALVALALFSFLDREVKGVVKSFLPLAFALAAAAVLAPALRMVAGVPRPLGGGGPSIGPLLVRAFPSGHAAAMAVFVTYGALAYGRRAVPALAAAAALGVARALGAAHWAAELSGGLLGGAALATAAYVGAIRLFPHGHLARLRQGRRRAQEPAGELDPGSP
jgi:membrane-associated phospholipid phosphatase